MEQQIGKVVHVYDKIGVAIIELTAGLKKGATVRFVGKKTDFSQTVDSLEIDHQQVEEVEAGKQVGVKLVEGYKARVGDDVFVVTS